MQLNRGFDRLEDNYLFATVANKVDAFKHTNPDADIIRLGIGDVTLPLCPAVTQAMHGAVDDMATREGFHGYGPYEGYEFLREAIRAYYAAKDVALGLDEIFVSDGAKSDVANILELFDVDNTVLIPDPVYPVYLDSNLMAGRRVLYMNANEKNGFLPLPDPAVRADLIYLCSPGNPTGAVYGREGLQAWVDYANRQGAVILFDAAYEAFVADKSLPTSIYQIPGAETCAIELCSLSKTAGFTGTRCGYTVIPRALERQGQRLAALWLRRQSTKFNGVPYVVQRGAAAVFSAEGQAQVRDQLGYYMQNAGVMAETLRGKGIWFVGGDNSPYIWLRCPGGMDSWSFFDLLLRRFHLVGTPGAGFGPGGEGFFRLTAFGERERTREAMERLAALEV